MAIDRNRAFTVSNNGILLEDGSHLSSGIVTPTHSGLAGDKYYKLDGTVWSLIEDGSAWVIVSNGATSLEFSNNVFSSSGEIVNSSSYVVFGYGTLNGVAGTGKFIAIAKAALSGSVTVRLYNVTTATEMGEVVFTETVITRKEVSITLPNDSDIVEVQAKRVGGSGTFYAAEIS